MQLKDPEFLTEDVSAFSIIIPFRNEINHLPELIACLNPQIGKFSEVILVNDDSTDGSLETVNSLIKDLPNFQVLTSTGKGKKNAISEGIHQAKHLWIITLDADVILSAEWSSQLMERLDNADDMVILPVAIHKDKTLLQKFEAFDFLALQGFTFCYARDKKPFLANGAHLAFKKNAWLEVQKRISHQELASGDDVFLLEAFKNAGKQIGWEWSEGLIAKTESCSGFREFLHQRVRWGSKTSKLNSKEAKWLSILIVLANLALLGLLVFGLWKLLVLAFIIKTVVDINLMIPVLLSYQRKDLIMFLPVFAILYPIYITFAGIASLIIKPTWKGRKI